MRATEQHFHSYGTVYYCLHKVFQLLHLWTKS